MAHSILAFNSSTTIFNDLDLVAILNLVERNCGPDLADVVGSWWSAVHESGPGTIDFCLDVTLGGARRQLLSNCLKRVLADLSAVPDDFLQTRDWTAPSGTRFVESYDVERVRDAVTALLDLIKE